MKQQSLVNTGKISFEIFGNTLKDKNTWEPLKNTTAAGRTKFYNGLIDIRRWRRHTYWTQREGEIRMRQVVGDTERQRFLQLYFQY